MTDELGAREVGEERAKHEAEKKVRAARRGDRPAGPPPADEGFESLDIGKDDKLAAKVPILGDLPIVGGFFHKEVSGEDYDYRSGAGPGSAFRAPVAQVLPLKINIPMEGMRYAFTKTMSTERGAEMAVKSTFLKRGGGTIALAVIYALLWAAAILALVAGARAKDRGKLTVGGIIAAVCIVLTFTLII